MRCVPLFAVLVLLSAPGPAPAADAAAGAERFKLLCATCHGPQGKGDGAAAAGLPVKPRDLGDAAWQASVDDAYLRAIIQKGGAALGKSPLMAPFGTSLSEQQLDDVIAYIRSLD